MAAAVSGASQRGSARAALPAPRRTGQRRGSSSGRHRPAAAPPPRPPRPPPPPGPQTAAAPRRRPLRGRGAGSPDSPGLGCERGTFPPPLRVPGPAPMPPVPGPSTRLPVQLLLWAAELSGVPDPRAPASRAFPPAGPTSCASREGRTGAGRSAEPARSGYKVPAPGCERGIKEGAGPDTRRNSWEGAEPPQSADSGYFRPGNLRSFTPSGPRRLAFSGGAR
ncbi:unnamed protein product [Rangifer tarandus platyrhynchus]|uniref:Basic proline-rich protein-like n=2 Tax=Rangifer tarandus platyrhynchus TaxID=3082113 RepID=A0ABN8ZPG9_RANTA|nr:unnamed protein product [Rangifer tarandus platyrhynchus]CAI9708202.1 unnamed protein product [Rangifer tarandus platyrhynchus]